MKHIQRGHDPGSWCVHLLTHKQLSFINAMRATFSYSGSSRTNTRCRIGGVSQRWEQGHLAASEFVSVNPLVKEAVSQVDNMPVTRTALLEQLEAVIQQIEN